MVRDMERYSQYFLYPCALFSSKEPTIVKTILGSCVAVCLWDSKLKIGGINHYMLPNWNGNEFASPKYGNIAIDKLINRMISLGSNISDIEAKIFGGADMFSEGKSQMRIGDRNIRIAKLILKQRKIKITSSSTGGRKGRKIVFFSDTGVVRQKFLS